MPELARRSFLLGLAAAAPTDRVRGYFSGFNAFPGEPVESHITDEQSFEWVMDLCPRFECPDAWVERIYYYRWWSFRKHLRKTPAGFIFTEFLRPVRHATDHNAISCALGHHIAEARWLADPVYGFCGLRPHEGGRVEVRPLAPEGAWDRDGSKFGQGAGPARRGGRTPGGFVATPGTGPRNALERV